MSDIVSSEKRSWIMSRIRSRDTRPEIMVRSILHRLGYRFSLRRRDLPGRPDIVLPLRRTVIFVHGCFWHRHRGCIEASNPKSRVPYWTAKFASNIARDRRNRRALMKSGWRVFVVWECQVCKSPDQVARHLVQKIGPRMDSVCPTTIPSGRELLRKAELRAAYNAYEQRKTAQPLVVSRKRRYYNAGRPKR
jgi:DNA mismatch endonuclease, patch repair protein